MLSISNNSLTFDGDASWVSTWFGTGGYTAISFTVASDNVASTDGTVSFEGTDDPSGTDFVSLVPATIHGDALAVTAADEVRMVVFSNLPAKVRVRYTRVAGGGTDQFRVHATRTG